MSRTSRLIRRVDLATWSSSLAAALIGCSNPAEPGEPVPPPPPPGPEVITWTTNAVQFRGQIGKRVEYRCPAAGQASGVWGTILYTDDSSICTAAVHAGKITLAAGGVVEITIQDGIGSYPSTSRNGVTSTSYGSWLGSFSFGVVTAEAITMNETAIDLRGHNDEVFAYTCAANGTVRAIWGTDVYTDDSSICTAAIHTGAIAMNQGGLVLLVVRPGRSAYSGSTRNGVTSFSYGSWHGSLAFR